MIEGKPIWNKEFLRILKYSKSEVKLNHQRRQRDIPLENLRQDQHSWSMKIIDEQHMFPIRQKDEREKNVIKKQKSNVVDEKQCSAVSEMIQTTKMTNQYPPSPETKANNL